MQTVKRNGLRLAAVMGAGVMLLAACGGSSSSSESSSAASGATGGDAPTKGGTVNVLTLSEQFNHLDPQRNYTGVDLAFASAYLNRTLTQYKLAPGPDGVTLVPDMATDTGTATEASRPITSSISALVRSTSAAGRSILLMTGMTVG